MRKHLTSTPLISVGLPTFNGEKFINQALNSLTQQTYKNIEIIVSNNASKDKTEEICLAYMKKKQIKYYKQKKTIPPEKNFNFVLNKAEGKYFIWMSDDDIWDKDFLQICVQEFLTKESENVGLVFPKYSIIDNKGRTVRDRKLYWEKLKTSFVDFSIFLKSNSRDYKGVIFLGLYDKKKLKDIGGAVISPPFAVVDLLTLHKFLAKYVARLTSNKKILLHYRQQKFRGLSRGNEKMFFYKKGLLFLKLLFKMCGNIVKPKNLNYLFSKTRKYFSFNNDLIKKMKISSTNKAYLTYLNLLSSIWFLSQFIFTDIKQLKRYEKFYSRTEQV